MTTRSVAVLVLVAVVGLAIAPFASGAVVTAPAADDGTESEPNASVSTFMQASTADAENTIDAEMFAAKYNGSDNESRETLVLERTGELDERVERLEAEREALREQQDDLHPGEYRARMTQLTVEIRALEREIDRTERRANETGVDTDRLDELRDNAANLSGPEVAEIARGLAGVDEPPGRGPPDGTPGNGNGPPGAENGTPGNGNGPPGTENGTPGNGNGPPDGDSETPGNGSGGGGAPDHANGGPGDGPAANDSRTDRRPANGNGNADRGPPTEDGDNGPSPDRGQPSAAGPESDAAPERDPTADGSTDDDSTTDSQAAA